MNAIPKAALAAALALGASTACSMFRSKASLNTSPDIPAAKAKADFHKTDNGNTAIALNVDHLATPDKLSPPAGAYVVWVQGDQTATPQNVGALKVDEDRHATLETVTPLKSFQLFVTPEPSGQVQQPSGQRLLWTEHGE